MTAKLFTLEGFRSYTLDFSQRSCYIDFQYHLYINIYFVSE